MHMSKLLSSLYWIPTFLCFCGANFLTAAVPIPEPIPISLMERPQVKVDLLGNALVVWAEFKNNSSGVTIDIMASTVKQWEWSEPVTISTADANRLRTLPRLATDTQGRAIAIWGETDPLAEPGTSDAVVYATYSAGEWESPQILTNVAGYDSNPDIAMDPSGYTVAVWKLLNDTHHMIQSSTLQLGDVWSNPVNISPPSGSASYPKVSLDYFKNAVAIWKDDQSLMVQTASLPHQGNWSEPVNLSPSSVYGSSPQIAMNGSGYAVAIWGSGDGTDFSIQSASLQFGENWSAPTAVTAPGDSAYALELSVDELSNAIAAWVQSNLQEDPPQLSYFIQTSYNPAGGKWSQPKQFAPTKGYITIPAVAFDLSGNAYVTWLETQETSSLMRGAFLPVEGNWSKAMTLSLFNDYVYFPQIACDPTGGTLLTWKNTTLKALQTAKWQPVPVLRASIDHGLTR